MARSRFGPTIALVLAMALWMVPLFSQLHKRFPYFGSLLVPTLVLSVVFGGAVSALYFGTGGHLQSSRRNVIVTAVTLGIVGLSAGILWAPVINALDFASSAQVVDGEILVIEDAARNSPNRTVSAVVDGETLKARFYAQNFWDAPIVRLGGPAKLTVRPGLFTPWVSKFDSR